MAIVTSYNGLISVNAVDLSDHCTTLSLNTGQETREASCMGNAARVFRPGIQSIAVEATFKNDHASGSVESTLRGLVVGTTGTGYAVVAQKIAGSATVPTSTNNPKYTFTAILDGDLMVLNDEHGEIAEITARFVPYSGSVSVSTTATS